MGRPTDSGATCDNRVRLWDVDHPYYCNEGCFHERGYHTGHGSWRAFLSEMGDSDGEMNLLFRWDWKVDEDTGEHSLLLFFVAQRKGFTFSHEVDVTKADEPAVHDWLCTRRAHIDALWQGVSHGE